MTSVGRSNGLCDGQGNVSAITDAAGTVVERYFYTPEGQLLVTNHVGEVRASSDHEWRYLFKGGREDGQGIYRIGTGEWDYLQGGTLEHDPLVYWGERLSITPESLGTYDTAVTGLTPFVAGIGGFLAGGPVGAWLAFTSVSGFTGGYERFQDGQGLIDSIKGGVYDGTGAAQVWGALENEDIITGQSLDWSDGQRWVNGILGSLQLAGPLAYGAGKLMSSYADDIAAFGARLVDGPSPAVALSSSGIRTAGAALAGHGFSAWASPSAYSQFFKQGRSGGSAREQLMGRTPSKWSRTGREVRARMRSDGNLKGRGIFAKVRYVDPKTGAYKFTHIRNTHMAHRTDAVRWWKSIGMKFGPKSPEVRRWMLDPDNYELQPRWVNRSEGAQIGLTYR